MSMIERIANEFGLELEQEFTIHERRYKFTKDGLFWYDIYKQDWFLGNDTLRSLIIGKLDRDLIKTNWKPKYGETYYFPCFSSIDCSVNSFTYNGDDVDNYYFTNNLMCKTKEEAEEFYNYIIEKIKEYRNNDI